MNENLIGNKYRILRQIGEGSFGKVFEGEHNRTKEKVAIKMEQITMDFKLLKNESKAYLLLAKETGFPRIKWYGVNDDDFYMVIDYLGPSLSSFKEEVDVLDMNLIIKLGIQMIDRVKSVHSAGLLHRDIKPDNFLFGNRVGFGSKEPILHLVDFGLCRSYKLPNGDHISLRTGKAMIGSPFFVSLNMHKGLEPSRRDDLESVVYVMAHLLSPNTMYYPGPLKEEKVIENKNNLLLDSGSIIGRLLKYCRGLKFEEEPNYQGLISVLQKELK